MIGSDDVGKNPDGRTPGESDRQPLFDESTQLGRDLAAVDWAATPVGDWRSWPASLVNTVRLMVGSRFPMWMAWGPDLVFFCNDDYRRDTLAAKYPWALGRPAHEVWSEIWPDIGPRIESVISTGVATWDAGLLLFLERSGYVEETYHTFSYSPIHDDDGGIAGMLCVVSEDTARVISQRRIALLSTLGAHLSAALTEDEVAATADAQLATDPYDVPFAITYTVDGDNDTPDTARLSWACGFSPGDRNAPLVISLGDRDATWHDGVFPADVRSRVLDLSAVPDLPAGGWQQPPVQAVSLPLLRTGSSTPSGYLIIGINPFREFDDEYRSFLELIAGQIAASNERAQALQAERDRVERLAELDRAKTAFFTNVSHELRTPLTLLLGPTEDALTDSEHALEETQRARVEVVQRNGERLLKLVNTLLDFSRLESGRVEAAYEQLDLHRFTTELASMFESAYTRAGLDLEIDCVPLRTRPYVDREMWSKIVLNLLSNALKATFDGGVTVRLDELPDGNGVQLQVIDTGVGIPDAELGQLFERFHRVAGAELRTHEGSGIGLALVSELVHLHGGTITVDSRLGHGTTFTVTVPFGSGHLPPEQVLDHARDDAPDAARYGVGYVSEAMRWSVAADSDRQLADSTDADSTDAASAARILVVDDNADMREYVADLLHEQYAVATAPNGQAALEHIRAEPPDLVLTDVMMPVLDGFGLLAELRADPATMHIPVVMLSARSGDEATVEGLEAGADDYLIKPFAARELLARVRANLELDRVRRVLAELRRSQQLLDNAEALAHIGSWEIDLRTDRVRMSTEHLRLLGLPEHERELTLERTMSALPDEERALFAAAVERAVEHGETIDLELHVNRTDGKQLTARVGGVRIDDADGAAVFVRGSTQDVTAQRAAEAELSAAHAEREVAAREHSIATELQQSLLPPLDLHSDALEIAAFYRAGLEGTQVGGDWYDVIDLGGGRTALVIGDVMGRGVKAAAVMGQLRAAIRAYARLGLGAEELLRLLDGIVAELSADTLVTCVYAVHDPAGGQLTYANAGHLPPLLTTPDGKTRRLVAGGPPLGTRRLDAAGERVDAPAGSLLTLYTDGLVERRGADIDSGIDNLTELVSSSTAPPAQLIDALTDTLLTGETDDDVALLLSRIGDIAPARAVAERSVTTDNDALSSARRFVSTTFTAWNIADSVAFDAQVAVSELVTNALKHGGLPITLRLLLRDDDVTLEVRDSGTGRPALKHSQPDDEGGRGLLIVASLASEWGTDTTANGKIVWCRFVLDAD